MISKTMIKIMLPLPPSSNVLYATNFMTRRRFPSKAYLKWKKTASGIVPKIFSGLLKGRISAEYAITFPEDKRKRDLENYVKAISDLLVEHKIIVDDSYIDRMLLTRDKGNVPGVHITLKEIT